MPGGQARRRLRLGPRSCGCTRTRSRRSSSLMPTAKPRAVRGAGVGVRPQKAVTSAAGRRGTHRRQRTHSSRSTRHATRHRFISVTSSIGQRQRSREHASCERRTRASDGPRASDDNFPLMDLRPTPEQELLRRTVREFAEAEIRPHVMEWDEAQAFPRRPAAEAGRARPDGHPGARGVRRRRACRRSTTASASRSWRASIRRSRCRSRRTTGCASAHLSMFGNEAQKQQYLVPLAKGEHARRVGR